MGCWKQGVEKPRPAAAQRLVSQTSKAAMRAAPTLSDLTQAWRTRAAAWLVFLRRVQEQARRVGSCQGLHCSELGPQLANFRLSRPRTRPLHCPEWRVTGLESGAPHFGDNEELVPRDQTLLKHAPQRLAHFLLVLIHLHGGAPCSSERFRSKVGSKQQSKLVGAEPAEWATSCPQARERPADWQDCCSANSCSNTAAACCATPVCTHLCAVNVSIACLQRSRHCGPHLARRRLPCAQSNGRHASAISQRNEGRGRGCIKGLTGSLGGRRPRCQLPFLCRCGCLSGARGGSGGAGKAEGGDACWNALDRVRRQPGRHPRLAGRRRGAHSASPCGATWELP